MRLRAANTFVVFVKDGGWAVGVSAGGSSTLHDVDFPPDTSPRQAARAAAQRLAGLGYRGERVVLALPSPWCLCATVATGGMARKDRHKPLVFRLEEKLPVAAEDVAADFVLRGGEALGVCAPVRLVKPAADGLEEEGVRVETICPAAMLAVEGLAAEGDVVLWGDGPHVELVQLVGGLPKAWYYLPHEAADVLPRLELLKSGPGGSLNVRAIHISPAVRDALSAVGVGVTDGGGETIALAATAAAGRVQGGGRAPWIDLRRDGLAPADAYRRFRRPLVAAVVAGLALLACLTGALFWRAYHYQQLARSYESLQAAVFRETFPGQPVPETPKSRLASEERKLQTAGGASASGTPQGSALLVLYEALTRLPREEEDARYRVISLKTGDGQLTLEGQARSHADAEAVAESLRKGGGFLVQLPQSENLGGPAGAVRFTVNGAYLAPTLPAGKPGKAKDAKAADADDDTPDREAP